MQISLNIQLTKSVKDPDRSSCVLIFRLRRRFPRFISSPLTLTWGQRLRRLNCCSSKTFGSNVPYNDIPKHENVFHPFQCSKNRISFSVLVLSRN